MSRLLAGVRGFGFAAAIAVVVIGAAGFRLPRLVERPMHADEANQAMKTGELQKIGVYQYDVTDHHGPSLYWLTLPSLWLRGEHDVAHSTEWSYRAVPVVFGIALVALAVLLADGLGRHEVFFAGILTAISPAMVFYSRYYIQEMLLVFFTLAAIASAWRFLKKGSIAWALAAGASLGMMHATKETWILAAAAMAAALVMTWGWTRLRDGARPAFTANLCLRTWLIALSLGGAVACLVAIALYSSFSMKLQVPCDSILAYGNYFRRGSEGGIHAEPWYYYLELLFAYRPARGFFWSEGLIAGLAIVGAVYSLALSGKKTADDGASAATATQSPALLRFLTFYTLVLTCLYAGITYKTPWCALSFLDAMILLAGVGTAAIVRWAPGRTGKMIVLTVLAAGAVHLGWQSYRLNYQFCTDARNPYVYAHTSPGIVELGERLDRLAERSPDGFEMAIHVVTPENFWPMPWYLRRFNPERVGYWQEPREWLAANAHAPPPAIILLTAESKAEVDSGLRAEYNQLTNRRLRPGVLLLVYVRNDLWPAFVEAASPPAK
jgi:uncharacterized protein (TIGR03663 family)